MDIFCDDGTCTSLNAASCYRPFCLFGHAPSGWAPEEILSYHYFNLLSDLAQRNIHMYLRRRTCGAKELTLLVQYSIQDIDPS